MLTEKIQNYLCYEFAFSTKLWKSVTILSAFVKKGYCGNGSLDTMIGLSGTALTIKKRE